MWNQNTTTSLLGSIMVMNSTSTANLNATLDVTANSTVDVAENGTKVDFFGPMFEHTTNRIALTFVFIWLITLGNAAGGAIIAFEMRAGADMRRTLLNTIIAIFFGNVIFTNTFISSIEIFRIWCGPYPLWLAQLISQIIVASSLNNILLIKEFILAKYIYACVIQTVGQVKEDLLGVFLPIANMSLAFFALAIFIMADNWPNVSKIAVLAGADPAIVQAKKDSHFMGDPSMLVNAMGPTILFMAIFVWLKVAAKKRKIGMAPAVNDHNLTRDPATGLPIVPLAPLAVDLGRMVFMITLLTCFVAVPSVLLSQAMKELPTVMTSPVLSFIVAFLLFFKFHFTVLVVVPIALFASNPLLRSFVWKSIVRWLK